MRNPVLALFFLASTAFAQPRIDSISPSRGPIVGGTAVTVSGTNLAGLSVTIDDATVTPLSASDSEVRLSMPAHDNGYAVIHIGSAAAEFLYVPPRLEDIPPGYITTVAGVGKYIRFGFPATQSMVVPWDVAIGPDGQIYFIQTDRGIVFRIDSQGDLRHVAGNLRMLDWNNTGDGGPATQASFGFPRSLALDAAGNVYIGDQRSRIRKIDAASGIVSTIAGHGEAGFSGDGGPATAALLGGVSYIAAALDGTVYFLDPLRINGILQGSRVRKVSPNGIITTIAGNGVIGDDGDGGPGPAASINIGVDDEGDLAIDAQQNVFILEHDGKRVRRVDATTGVITTFVSLAFPPGDHRDIGPSAIATDAAGNLWVATSWNMFEFDASGNKLKEWGTGHGHSPDGTAAPQMMLGGGRGMAIASNGDVLFSDSQISRLRKIDAATQRLSSIAGMGPNVIGVPGDPLGAVLGSPSGDLTFTPSGDLIYGDGSTLWIYRIDLAAHTMIPFAGNGTYGGAYEEAPALETAFYCAGLTTDDEGDVYVADKSTVRVIGTDGIVHRVAGLRFFQYGFSGDGGPADEAALDQPADVKRDLAGNLFIADTNNNRIRRVDAKTHVISTVAGSGPVNGFENYGAGSLCGDGGPALSACFNTPIAVAVRDDGTMFVNDYFNDHRIRRIASDGVVSSIVGTPPPNKLIAGPGGSIFSNAGGVMFRIDHDRARIVAGRNTGGFSGDGGPALDAEMTLGESELAQGLAIDRDGNLFFHDSGNRRIRAVRLGAVTAPQNATIEAVKSGTRVTVTVRDAEGFTAPGVRVDFTVPAAGASCVLSSPFAITDEDGVAAVTCTPNCHTGTFVLTARPLTASSTATTTFVNSGSPCHRRPVRR